MDIRSEATKNRIKLALIKCMEDAPYANISNIDIIKKAEISSRTLYKHYKNKDEILKEIEDELIEQLKEANEEDSKAVFQIKHKLSNEENLELAKEEFKHLTAFCESIKGISQILLSPNGDINYLNRIHDLSVAETKKRLKYLIKNNLIETSDDAMIPCDMVITTYAEVIVNIIITWLRYDTDLTVSNIRRILGLVQIKSPSDLLCLMKKKH